MAQFPELRRSLWAHGVNSVFIGGAGAVAEAKIARRRLVSVWLRGSCDDDYSRSHMAFEPFIESEADRRRAIYDVWENGSTILRRHPNWEAICAVAEALLASDGYLDGDTTERIIGNYIPDVPDSPLAAPSYSLPGL